MKIDLDNQVLVDMICGSEPSINIIDHGLIKEHFDYNESIGAGQWNRYTLNNRTINYLLRLYEFVRESQPDNKCKPYQYTMQKTGIQLISDERTKQIEVHGWTKEHDAHHSVGELANAAANYAMTYCAAEVVKTYLPIPSWPMLWPFENMKPKAVNPEDRIKELTKAGAFIAAEIDRLLRLQELKKIIFI